jgi:hypothetical protein
MAKVSAKKIDQMMEVASGALAETDYFTAERESLRALEAAHAARDYERMARICLPLQEARRQKRLTAADSGKLVRLSETLPTDEHIEPACYLIEPMMVGADGRDLRERADQLKVPVLVVVREPRTSIGEWPIVMIGPTTVRTRVEAPADEEPTIEWMLMASEALGDEAIREIDAEDNAADRVDDLMDRLGTCREHEKLHQRLAEACRDADEEQRRSEAEKKAKKASKG